MSDDQEVSSNGEFAEEQTSTDQQKQDFSADDSNFGDYSAALGQQFEEQPFAEQQQLDSTTPPDEQSDDKPLPFQSTDIEPTGRDYTTSPYYQQMLTYGVADSVIGELIEMIESGILKPDEVEERLFETVKTVRPDHCAFILRRFRESNLLGINNIPAYLGSLLKNFKERVRQVGDQTALAQPIISAPPAEKIQEILDRTGYSLEVTIGQRKYGGPPPDWGDAPVPGNGHELYVGKLPRDVMEDELIPLFEELGKMYDLRLMMDPISGYSKGYAFVTYVTKEAAVSAQQKYEGFEIRKGKRIRVNVSIANTRLFIGNIPKSKGKEEIYEEFTKAAELEGITEVIIYASPDDPLRKKNRGFCFLEFSDHRAASQAKRRLAAGRIRPWNGDIVVDWAEPQDEPDDSVMSQVKVVYIKPLKEAVTEDELKDIFTEFGEIERVKKIKDYAFIHFMERDSAMKAIEGMNGKELHGDVLNCSLARPQMERKKRHDGGRGSVGSSMGFGRGRGSLTSSRGGQGSTTGGYGYYGRGSGQGMMQRGGGYGYGGDAHNYYGGGGEYDYGAGDAYGGGYNYGYGSEAGSDWYSQQQAYAAYYGDPSGYSQAASQYAARGGRSTPRAGSRGRGGVAARGYGSQSSGANSGRGYGGGGMGARGFSPRGGGSSSAWGGGRGYRGGQAGQHPMKRKGAELDNGASKRRPGGGRGGARGGWNSRGGASASYQQGWGSAENFAEDDPY